MTNEERIALKTEIIAKWRDEIDSAIIADMWLVSNSLMESLCAKYGKQENRHGIEWQLFANGTLPYLNPEYPAYVQLMENCK